MTATHVTTLRVTQEMYERMEAVARMDGIPVSELVRQAIASHLEKRRADPAFRARLRARIEKDQRLLDRLSHPRS